MFVYFNRSDKPEYKCLSEMQWLIKIAKDPMYECAQKVKDKFFFDPCFSVLFTLFAKSKEGQKFTKKQFEAKNPKYIEVTCNRIQELGDYTLQQLKSCTTSKPRPKEKIYV